MPTVILLDVSFSMCQPVAGTKEEEGSTLLKKDLAAMACCQILDHLQQTNKLEFVALMIYSSLYEVVVSFTRDYSAVREAIASLGDYDRTCLSGALAGAVQYCKEEWGNCTPCQIVVISDGCAGAGQGVRALPPRPTAALGPLPVILDVVCLTNQDDPALQWSLPVYQRYVEQHGEGSVHVPQGKLTKKSSSAVMAELLRQQLCPYHGVLQCGALSTGITLAPPPQSYTSARDGSSSTSVREIVSTNISVLGFVATVDVSSPPAFSRHLLLPHKDGNSASQADGSDDEMSTDDGKTASLCVLLHGGLKKESMVALCQVAPDWYGILYSWSDNKKKSNLLLSIFQPGGDVIPWLGKLDELGPASALPVNPYTTPDATPPFPVKSGEKRSYSQACVVWIRPGGVPSDVSKITRHARKLPEKVQSFYKELNRVRRAAIQYGFPSLLLGVCSVLEREALALPLSAQPEGAMQLQHAGMALKAAAESAMDPNNTDNKHHSNILPLRTNF